VLRLLKYVFTYDSLRTFDFKVALTREGRYCISKRPCRIKMWTYFLLFLLFVIFLRNILSIGWSGFGVFLYVDYLTHGSPIDIGINVYLMFLMTFEMFISKLS
jgi:hypothetical protein